MLLSVVNLLQAQSLTTKTFVEYTKWVEQQFSTRFSYINEDVTAFSYTYQTRPQSLEDALQLMRFQSPIDLQLTIENNYSVTLSDDFLCVDLKDVNFYNLSHVRFETMDTKSWFSDVFGKIYLSQKDSYNSIRISHKTYEAIRIDLAKLTPKDCFEVILYDVKSLDEITIYEYLTRGLQLSADGRIQLTPSEFSPLPGLIEPDVFHSLQYVPGAVNTQESIADINIRGGTHDQNLVLWNGARMYQTSHFFGMISAINPSITHRIDVYKNASSAFYTDGVSGVIDITSVQESTESKKNRLGVAINLLDAQAFADQDLSFGQIAFSTRASYNDLWESPSFQNYFDKVFQNTRIFESETQTEIPLETRTSFNYYDAAVHFNSKFKEKHHINFNATGILNRLNFDELNLLNNQQKNNKLEQSSLLSSLNYSYTWSNEHKSQVRATASFYKLDAINQAINSEQILDQQNSVFDTGIDLRHEWTAKDAKLNFGYQFNEIGVRNDNIINIPQLVQRDKKVLMRHSLIATLDAKLFNKKLNTHLGIRGNYYDRFNVTKAEPSIRLSTDISPFWSLSLLGEQKYQAMNQVIDVQQDFLGVEKRRWVLSDNLENPLLQNLQAELQSLYRKKNWLLQLSLFYKKVEHIASRSQGFQNQLEFLNIPGDYEVYGIETLIQKKWKFLRVWANYSYNENNYFFPEFTENQRFANNFELKHAANAGINLEGENYHLSLGGRFLNGKPTTLPNAVNPVSNPNTNPTINFKAPNSDRLETYYQINVSGSYSYSINSGRITAGASVLNLLNSEQVTHQFFRIRNGTAEIENVQSFGLDLTFNAFLKLEL